MDATASTDDPLGTGTTTDAAAVRDEWDGVADAWSTRREELAAFTRPVFDRLLATLDPDPDDAVLELACGTGALGRAIASSGATVTQTDISPRMVATARQEARERGLADLTVEVADAHALPYDDGSFDAVACQMGFMLMPRPLDALRNCRRVLRPGGRLVFATWGAAERNPWVIAIGAAFLQHGHSVQGNPTGPGGVFSLSDPASIRGVVTAAGFQEVHTTPVPVSERFTTFEHYWDLHLETGGPMRTIADRLDLEAVTAVRETCRGFCESFRTDDGYEFPGEALVTLAR